MTVVEKAAAEHGGRGDAALPVWIGPHGSARLTEAVARGGGVVVGDAADARAIVWNDGEPQEARAALHDGIEWVQLDSVGIDHWLEIVDRERIWASVRDVYAADVAEHVLAFILAAARRLPQAAQARRWSGIGGERLAGRTVGLVGAGAIGRQTIVRLRPFGVRVIALTRSGRDVPGADESLPRERLTHLLECSDYVVLAAPLTAETRGLVGRRELERLGSDAWLVNVGRGPLVDTDALVQALADRAIGGACLDVTDPEPLPAGHPLWKLENVLLTPHVANPPGTWEEPLAGLVEENVRRFAAGRELLAIVDVDRGY